MMVSFEMLHLSNHADHSGVPTWCFQDLEKVWNLAKMFIKY